LYLQLMELYEYFLRRMGSGVSLQEVFVFQQMEVRRHLHTPSGLFAGK